MASDTAPLLGITPWRDDRSAPTAEAKPPTAAPAPDSPADAGDDEQYRLHRRFDRLGRLFGDGAVSHLMSRRVAVFGLGGVGSFAAEALARSAVGHLMLVDFDKVCITNSNRQLQAMYGTVGKDKAALLAERVRLINPAADVVSKNDFYGAESSDELLRPPWPGRERFDFVVDCIDNLTAKAHLIATCKKAGIPVVSSMGAAGKLDPTQVQIGDLGETTHCRLARDLRRILRKHHGFPEDGPMGVSAVFSEEARTWPRELSYDGGQGFKCVCPHKSDEHGCDSRSLIDGTVVFVTGAFGLACSSVVVRQFATEGAGDEPALAAKQGTRQRD